ncbi:MAG: hypothetical protein ACO1O6_15475 [Bacteroidota bacterium]
MTRRQLKKAAYEMIVKENNSHQETFDSLRKDAENGSEELAGDISSVPSRIRQQQNQVLIYIYVALLGLIIIFRSLTLFLLLGFQDLNPGLIFLIIALGLVVPGIGIYGALTRRAEIYRTTGILLLISIIRSFSNGQIDLDPLTLAFLTPGLATIVLAFYIPTRLKTGFTKKVVQEETDGKIRKRTEITFENSDKILAPDVLDANL